MTVQQVIATSPISADAVAAVKSSTGDWIPLEVSSNPLAGLTSLQINNLLVGETPVFDVEKAGQADANLKSYTPAASFDSRTKWANCAQNIR